MALAAIVVADGDRGLIEAIARGLRSEGHRVSGTSIESEVVRACRHDLPDLVILGDGLVLQREVVARDLLRIW